MSRADRLRARAQRFRALQTRVWDLEALARIKRRNALRLADRALALRVEVGEADEQAQALRRSVLLYDGEGLTQRIKFLEEAADKAEEESNR